jgi:hypothetical protein
MAKVDQVFQLAAANAKAMPKILQVLLKQVEVNAAINSTLLASMEGDQKAQGEAIRQAIQEGGKFQEEVFQLIDIVQRSLQAADVAIDADRAGG